MFSGDYERSGADLIVSDRDHRVVVPDYFHGEKRPALVSPEGAPLDPKVIEALTGHVAYAQAAGTALLLGTASISILGYEHNVAEVPAIVLWNGVSKEF